MAINYNTGDYAPDFNSVYNFTLDMSGWSQTTIDLVAPMSGAVLVYGTNDGGAIQGVRYGSARNAQNFTTVLATNLATGATSGTLSAPGVYTVPVNAQYLRFQGSPAAAGTNVYKILLVHSKVD